MSTIDSIRIDDEGNVLDAPDGYGRFFMDETEIESIKYCNVRHRRCQCRAYDWWVGSRPPAGRQAKFFDWLVEPTRTAWS